MMYSESPTSPSWISTVCLGNVRGTPDAAIVRSTSSRSGAKAISVSGTGMGSRIPLRFAGHASTGVALLVLSHVVDHLAVVRQLPGRPESDFTSQLRDLANRGDDRLGMR